MKTPYNPHWLKNTLNKIFKLIGQPLIYPELAGRYSDSILYRNSKTSESSQQATLVFNAGGRLIMTKEGSLYLFTGYDMSPSLYGLKVDIIASKSTNPEVPPHVIDSFKLKKDVIHSGKMPEGEPYLFFWVYPRE
jgi:hypothetical protein